MLWPQVHWLWESCGSTPGILPWFQCCCLGHLARAPCDLMGGSKAGVTGRGLHTSSSQRGVVVADVWRKLLAWSYIQGSTVCVPEGHCPHPSV